MYFQTWMYWTRIRKIPFVGKRIYLAGQWLCGKLTGHPYSKTEWGYGGGGKADVWCRWCNKEGVITTEELVRAFEKARNIIWKTTGCDVNHKEWKPGNTKVTES